MPTLGSAEVVRVRNETSDRLANVRTWSDELIASTGLPVIDKPFITIGGGSGSFVMVDLLRISGVPADRIAVLTTLQYPWQNYEYLVRVSQIPEQGRLRSDSASCPDNIWAYPSYAFREAFAARTVGGFLKPFWSVLTENILSDYWTPKSIQMFHALKREADRIGYWDCVVPSQVMMVHRREGGGYYTLATKVGDASQVLYRSRFVYLAVGYPGLRFLDDLQEYRQNYGDHHRVVHAYEPHEHVYQELARRGGTVVVRGAGIASSQILDRLISDRDETGSDVTIVHVIRTYVDKAHGPSLWMRRRGRDGWAYQGFNWPKSTWGGQGKDKSYKLEGEERAAFLRSMGGATTARRKRWREQLARGRREGFYQVYAGTVEKVVPGAPGSVVLSVHPNDGAEPFDLPANFIIDATGLEADIAEHPVLADLLRHRNASRNPLGRLDVERSFELRGARSGPGRIYAAGATTLGGYLAGVDTFLGLQISALEATDDLAQQGFCDYIGIRRSFTQWLKWIRNVAP
ncbi:MAG: hypothetical protein ACRDYC_11590 [Acidimicrobiales bacterium]